MIAHTYRTPGSFSTVYLLYMTIYISVYSHHNNYIKGLIVLLCLSVNHSVPQSTQMHTSIKNLSVDHHINKKYIKFSSCNITMPFTKCIYLFNSMFSLCFKDGIAHQTHVPAVPLTYKYSHNIS